MMNKDTLINTQTIKAFTPNKIKIGLESLPYHYANETMILLDEKFKRGDVSRRYTKRYIQKVKLNEAFNEEVFNALVEIGLKNKKTRSRFEMKKSMMKPLNK